MSRHFRVTRPEAYGPGTPGHTKPQARQGYYTSATDPDNAREIIRGRCDFIRADERLDVQAWDNGPEHGKVLP